jgi:hypothetical protein
MIEAVWKLSIVTSMVEGPINTKDGECAACLK